MITHDYQIIFTHIPKCAGRSVCDIFNQRFDHYTSNFYRKEYDTFWNRYHKFTIIRNPYDRMVSLYIYIKEHRRHRYEAIALNYHDEFPSFKTWLTENIKNYQGGFSLTSAEGQRGSDGALGSPFWFSSQFRRLCDESGTLLQQEVFKLEDGMAKVETYLNDITGMNVNMPHSNKSEYDDYRSFYDEELKVLAANFNPIKQDCIEFGYSFDN